MKGWVVTIVLSFFFIFSLWSLSLGQPAPPKKTPELLAQGKKLYEQNCVTCHGPKGDGKGPLGAALTPPPRSFNIPFKQWTHSKGDPKKVFEVITKGKPNTSMVKWDQISEKDRWALVFYTIEFAAPAKKTR